MKVEDMKKRLEAALTHVSILDLMAGIILVVGIILAFTQSGIDQATTGLFVAFLAYLLFMRQGRLATVKFNKEGFEATMAQAREATQEAKEITKEMNEFMKATSVAVLGLIKQTGRGCGYSYDDKEEIKQDILTNLSEMGISQKEIDDIEKRSRWHEYVAVDYVHCLLGGRFFAGRGGPSPEPARVKAKELMSRSMSDVPTPDELKELFAKHGIFTDETRELIEDYRYYCEHHKQRRPEVWAQRGEWFK